MMIEVFSVVLGTLFSGTTFAAIFTLVLKAKLTDKYAERLEKYRQENREVLAEQKLTFDKELAKVKSHYDKELADVNHQLELAKVKAIKQLDRAEALTQTVDRYTGVILIAAKDLQDRLWHLTQRQAKSDKPVLLKKNSEERAYGGWPMTKKHYLTSTLFLFGQYFAWIEILKREIRYLNFGDSDLTNQFAYYIKLIERSLAETKYQKLSLCQQISTDYPIFQMMQSELGCAMIVENESELRSMNFYEFSNQLGELEQTLDCFSYLEKLLVNGVSSSEYNFCHSRLKILNNSLVDLILFLNSHQSLVAEDKICFVEHKEFARTKPKDFEDVMLNSQIKNILENS